MYIHGYYNGKKTIEVKLNPENGVSRTDFGPFIQSMFLIYSGSIHFDLTYVRHVKLVTRKGRESRSREQDPSTLRHY